MERDIRAEIIDELRWDPRIDATKVAVAVIDGVALLGGTVHTYAEKCRCEEIVKRIRGTAVQNELDVRVTIGDYRSDETLHRVVRDVLDCLALLPEERPSVTVIDGWVTRHGSVVWGFQKRLAEDAVRQIAGVRGINNRIEVIPRSGTAINLKTVLDLVLQRHIPSDCSIEIAADDGHVTLTGTVHTCAERDEMIDLAWCAPGVRAVEDRLSVLP